MLNMRKRELDFNCTKRKKKHPMLEKKSIQKGRWIVQE